MADDNDEKIFESVKCLSEYFTSVVNTIPAKYYVPNIEQNHNAFNGSKKNKSKLLNKKLLNKKAKFHKLDPSKHKSIQELQQEVEKKEQEVLRDGNESEFMNQIRVSSVPSTSLEELRERLHAKMTELRGKRNLPANADKRLDLKKARLDRKVKENIKNKKSNEMKKLKNVVGLNENNSRNGPTLKNDRGEVVFSKFDFASGSTENNNKKKKKKNMYQLLEIAEKKKEKINQMKSEDISKAKQIEKEISWDNALKKSEGLKIKDDPKLLKKSIKRKEKLKEKSRAKWAEREETVQRIKEEKQRLRKEHLKERREDKSKKLKKSKKKKRGF